MPVPSRPDAVAADDADAVPCAACVWDASRVLHMLLAPSAARELLVAELQTESGVASIAPGFSTGRGVEVWGDGPWGVGARLHAGDSGSTTRGAASGADRGLDPCCWSVVPASVAPAFGVAAPAAGSRAAPAASQVCDCAAAPPEADAAAEMAATLAATPPTITLLAPTAAFPAATPVLTPAPVVDTSAPPAATATPTRAFSPLDTARAQCMADARLGCRLTPWRRLPEEDMPGVRVEHERRRETGVRGGGEGGAHSSSGAM